MCQRRQEGSTDPGRVIAPQRSVPGRQSQFDGTVDSYLRSLVRLLGSQTGNGGPQLMDHTSLPSPRDGDAVIDVAATCHCLDHNWAASRGRQ